VKKLISIGVALALLSMVVLPTAVAADEIMPSTYAKIPFAIVQSGFYLVGCLMGDFDTILGAMDVDLGFDLTDLTPIMLNVGDWAGVPLAWSVDMLAWGVGLVGVVMQGLVDAGLGVPAWVVDLVGNVKDELTACFEPSVCNNVSDAYTVPCSIP